MLRFGRFFGGSGESSESAIWVVRHRFKQRVTWEGEAPAELLRINAAQREPRPLDTYRSRASGMMT